MNIRNTREELHNFADEVHRMQTVIHHDIFKLIASVVISLHLFFLFHNLCPDEHELEGKGKHISSHISFNQTLSRTHIASEEHKEDIQPSSVVESSQCLVFQLFISAFEQVKNTKKIFNLQNEWSTDHSNLKAFQSTFTHMAELKMKEPTIMQSEPTDEQEINVVVTPYRALNLANTGLLNGIIIIIASTTTIKLEKSQQNTSPPKHKKNALKRRVVTKSHRSKRSEGRIKSRSKSVGRITKSWSKKSVCKRSSPKSGYDRMTNASSKDVSAPYKRPKPVRFISRITHFGYHQRARLPQNIRIYDQNKDLEDHPSIFSAAIEQ
ncbi:hypothetical protein Tco_0257071 [Tanacetum coccineum]